jgi:hypothetical protein
VLGLLTLAASSSGAQTTGRRRGSSNAGAIMVSGARTERHVSCQRPTCVRQRPGTSDRSAWTLPETALGRHGQPRLRRRRARDLAFGQQQPLLLAAPVQRAPPPRRAQQQWPNNQVLRRRVHGG